jgi:hypothetical protein
LNASDAHQTPVIKTDNGPAWQALLTSGAGRGLTFCSIFIEQFDGSAMICFL